MSLRTIALSAALAASLMSAGLAQATPRYGVIPGYGAEEASRDASPQAQARARAQAQALALARAEAHARATAQANARAHWEAQAQAQAYAQAYARQRQALAGGAIYNIPDAAPQAAAVRGQPPVAARQSAVRPGPVAHEPSRAAPQAPLRQQVAALPSDAGLQQRVDPRFARTVAPYAGPHAPGTIIVDTPSRYLYLVQPGGKAIRYGIGVGRPGFEWAGVKRVTRKAEWPDWTPPAEMLKRRPDLPKFMKGGIDNPLGARALYLGSSLYRIHGTNEPWTIGQNVSSGCIRMMNDDVIDLYSRVRVGTRVVVI